MQQGKSDCGWIVKGDLLELFGPWTVRSIETLFTRIRQEPQSSSSITKINCERLNALDTSGALAIKRLMEHFKVSKSAVFLSMKEEQARVLSLVMEKTAHEGEHESSSRLPYIARVGKTAVAVVYELGGLLSFLGETVLGFLRIIQKPRKFRPTEFFVQLEQGCVNAIPVLALVMMLIGVVLAFLFGDQVEKYGASIFVVDAVTVAVVRELSPVIVSVIIAGRSGSAFTAQIGSMVLNEEVDAIRTLGLSTIDVLVVPRVLALILAMPLLVFVGGAVGVIGGLFVANVQLGIMPTVFFNRIIEIDPRPSLWVGIVKAPMFALFVGLIACRNGFSVERNARSVGEHTTKTVVQSIVAVILLDAMFAVLFRNVGY